MIESNPANIDLHDARLKSIAADYVDRRVTVAIAYHPTPESPERVPAQIRFTDVTHWNEVTDLLELQNHAWAGNISYWVPAVGPGTTFIYLARGLISVTAGHLEFFPMTEPDGQTEKPDPSVGGGQ